MKKVFLLVFIVVSGCVKFCCALTYYVSPSGNNNNNGLSVASAFLTLQHASNTVAPGDSVIVFPGIYSGFYHTTSGTALLPIVFYAQAGAVINAPNSTTNDGINLEGASYIVIEGFKVYGVPRTGIRSVTNDHIIIRNNIADSCGVWGILTGFSEHITIEYNECSRAVQQHGIYFGNSADNPVIRYNVCWGNNDCGIHMNGDASLGGDGIISNALVENNILYDNGYGGGSAINCDGVQNSRIQNNLAFNNHASGISLFRIDGGGGSSGNVVVNNTILQPSDGRWALNISDGSTDNIVFNNILYSYHVFRGSISIDVASMAGFKSDHNIQTNRMSDDGGNTVITLSQWKQSTQLDSNSVIAAPASLFINPVAHDYHLLSNSLAKDIGVTGYYSVSAPASDLEGITRPQGPAPDAGAYEYVVNTGMNEPVQSTINWNLISDNDRIYLFDLSGKMLFKGYKKQLDIHSFSNSLYIIRMADQPKSLKLVLVQ